MTKPVHEKIEEQIMEQENPTDTVETADAVEPQVEDVLVEEISIDGMCGVY